MKETRQMEFKSEISNTFLKTVSAFANYDGGRILFGYDDNGKAAGLEDPEQACLNIENKINDSIRPQPDYELSIQESSRTVVLTVEAGPNKPYTYRSKAERIPPPSKWMSWSWPGSCCRGKTSTTKNCRQKIRS